MFIHCSVIFCLGLAFCVVDPSATSVAEEAKKSDAPKVTYNDHIRPIFREHCLACHNSDKARGGLSLDSYAAVIEGGSGGDVVFPDDLDASRIWTMVTHQETPTMPPEADKIPQSKIDMLEKWIKGGLLENSGSTARKSRSVALALTITSIGKPEGPAAMPEGVPQQPIIYTPRPGASTAIASSPWAPLVAIAGQKQIVLYNTDTAELLGVLPFLEGIPHVLKFSRNGEILMAGGGRGGHSGYVVLYNVRTGRKVTRLGDELDEVLAADISPDLKYVALGGPQKLVRIYSTTTGELVHQIKKHTDWIYAIEYSPDGVLLATADRSSGLLVWEADTAREYLNLTGHKGAVCDVSWRADSNVLASCSLDGSVKLWEMVNGNNIRSWAAHGGGALSIDYARNGQIATSGKDRTAKIWDGNGKGLGSVPTMPEAVLEVAFSYDGKKVIAGDWTGTTKMWLTADRKEMAALQPNPPTLAMRLDSAKKKVVTDKQTAEQKRVALVAAQTAAADSRNKLQSAQAALASKNKQLADVKSEMGSIAAKTADLIAKVNQQTNQLNILKATLNKSNAERDAADVVLKAKQDLLNQQSAHLSAERQALVGFRNSLKAVEEKVNASGAPADAESAKKLTELKVSIAQATNRIAAIETQHARINSEVDVATTDVNNKDKAIKANQQNLQTATNALQQLQAEKTKLATRSNELKSNSESLMRRIITDTAAVKSLTTTLAQKDQALKETQEEAAAAGKQAASSQAAVDKINAEIVAIAKKKVDLQQAEVAAQKKLQAADTAMKQSQVARDAAKKAVDDAAAKAAALKVEYDKLVAAQKAAQDKLAQEAAKATAAEQAAAEAASELQAAEESRKLFLESYPDAVPRQ